MINSWTEQRSFITNAISSLTKNYDSAKQRAEGIGIILILSKIEYGSLGIGGFECTHASRESRDTYYK